MRVWNSTPPAGCPFGESPSITDIAFTSEYETYTGADTWYPSWSADGHLYSPYTDGTVTPGRSVISFGQNPGLLDHPHSTTGQAKIVGDDPFDLEVVDLGSYPDPPYPYGGRYPCGSLVYDGVWYHGSYTLDQVEYNWDRLGPLVGFRISKDNGETWTDSPHSPSEPLFGESGKNERKVKLGAPHFVDFGQELEYTPDEKAYLVGHGATRTDANLSWISGDQVYMCRVEPGVANMNDPTAYEFFAGCEDGEAVWSDDFADIEPLFE